MNSTHWYSRAQIGRLVLSRAAQNAIIAVILINAVILGLETIRDLPDTVSAVLAVLDRACLAVFVVELALKLYAQGGRFFRNAWNVFDFLVVGVALVPGADAFAVLRALRVLRVFRLVSAIPALRRVVDALVRALPGIASIAALLVIIFYVSAVMSTMLFGEEFPQYFGDMGASLFSLFQIMTLDGWSDMAREVTEAMPWALAFFIPFVLISALTVLNLFIAVVVDAMQGLDDSKAEMGIELRHEVTIGGPEDAVASELRELRAQVAELTAAVKAKV